MHTLRKALSRLVKRKNITAFNIGKNAVKWGDIYVLCLSYPAGLFFVYLTIPYITHLTVTYDFLISDILIFMGGVIIPMAFFAWISNLILIAASKANNKGINQNTSDPKKSNGLLNFFGHFRIPSQNQSNDDTNSRSATSDGVQNTTHKAIVPQVQNHKDSASICDRSQR